MTVKGNESDVDASFNDFLDNLNGIFTVHFDTTRKHVEFLCGYRALYQDYETGNGSKKFAYDATMHGPIIALNITW